MRHSVPPLVTALAITVAGAADAQTALRPALRAPPKAIAAPAPPRPAPLTSFQHAEALKRLAPGVSQPAVAQTVHLPLHAPSTASAFLVVSQATVVANPAESNATMGKTGMAQVTFQAAPQRTYLVDCTLSTIVQGAGVAYVIKGPSTAAVSGIAPLSQGHALFAVPGQDAGPVQVTFYPDKVDIVWYFYGCDVIPAL